MSTRDMSVDDERWTERMDDVALGERPARSATPPEDSDPEAWGAEWDAYAELGTLAAPVEAPGDAELVASLVAAHQAATPAAVAGASGRGALVYWIGAATLAGAALAALWWGGAFAGLGVEAASGEEEIEMAPRTTDGERTSGEATVRRRESRARPPHVGDTTIPVVRAASSDERGRDNSAAAAGDEAIPARAEAGNEASVASSPAKKKRVRPTDLPSPAELLAEARRLRGAKDLRESEKTYARLVKYYPSSPEAHASQVALGQLRLKIGKKRGALQAFERYLSKGGPLAEEAMWGKVQALDGLKRSGARDGAIDDLLRRFPRSVYKRRAEALRAPADP